MKVAEGVKRLKGIETNVVRDFLNIETCVEDVAKMAHSSPMAVGVMLQGESVRALTRIALIGSSMTG